MKKILLINNWLIIKVLGLVSLCVPLGILVYESIVLGNETVVFLADYPSALGIAIIIYYAILLILLSLWLFKRFRSILELRNEKAKNELLHLQSQVSPHFLFNMLNNLYGTIEKDASKAKEIILKLSDLMRYSIYEGSKKRVSVDSEVEYLQNYIALQKMRFHKSMDIQFQRSTSDSKVYIMPLMFIILVENAFKHGVENLRDKAYVYVTLDVFENKLKFTVENNFDEEIASEEKGIGIDNLRRRLELEYPKRHELVLHNENSIFRAQLELSI